LRKASLEILWASLAYNVMIWMRTVRRGAAPSVQTAAA
jgi:hypothetical protein